MGDDQDWDTSAHAENLESMTTVSPARKGLERHNSSEMLRRQSEGTLPVRRAELVALLPLLLAVACTHASLLVALVSRPPLLF